MFSYIGDFTFVRERQNNYTQDRRHGMLYKAFVVILLNITLLFSLDLLSGKRINCFLKYNALTVDKTKILYWKHYI